MYPGHGVRSFTPRHEALLFLWPGRLSIMAGSMWYNKLLPLWQLEIREGWGWGQDIPFKGHAPSSFLPPSGPCLLGLPLFPKSSTSWRPNPQTEGHPTHHSKMPGFNSLQITWKAGMSADPTKEQRKYIHN